MAHPMFVKHQDLLGSAVHAIESRGYWSPYADDPAAYGENAVAQGREALEAYADAQFYLDQPGVVGRGGGEESPYGLVLNVSYPKCSADALIAAGKAAMPAWIKAGPDTRAGVCAEILARLNTHSMETVQAVMHTTGQPFALAFQSGGPQAQDCGLEAVAYAWREMKHVPYRATWEKPQGQPVKVEKRFNVVPRGVALVIGSSNFPTLDSYGAIFASLATGNAVIVKPHPASILPLAITVALARMTLKEAGFDPALVSLLVDTAVAPVSKDVALKPDIRIIDYSGDAEFCRWLEDNARQAIVFAEKSGVNCVVVDSTADYEGMLRNLALSLSLYSGQMRTTPRTLLVSRAGVLTPARIVSSDQFGLDLGAAIGKLLKSPASAVDILGAIQSSDTLAWVEAAADQGEVIRAANAVVHPKWPDAAVRTPLLLKTAVADAAWTQDSSGPLAHVVETATTAESLALAERAAREQGALTFSVHTTNENIAQLAEEASLRVGVALSINLTGDALVNLSAAYSDYRVTGANPASGGGLTDSAFVASRFFVVQSQGRVA